jgi:nicotinate phosphoribosyltransferase
VAPHPDPDDPGLLSPAETSLLIDQYELAMAASYHRRGMDDVAVFELFVRQLPPQRRWLLAAGAGPALALVEAMRFGPRELEYLDSIGFDQPFLDHLAGLRFSGDVDAMPEGTIVFENEPLLRVTAPRIEGQLLETVLLNQVNFQTAIATKAARLAIAIGGGRPDRDGRLIDFSPRRDHGVDASMKAARAAAIAGAGGTSNVAAAMRYGLQPVGTMAHSYVMSFENEREAFVSFMQDVPDNTVMLVDTYDTVEGVRHAIEAARVVDVPLSCVRIDSGDLLSLSQAARRLLDEAGMSDTTIIASGDLDENRIAELVAAGAPIDRWGVGTDLGTSRDAPALGGVYKLVADRVRGDSWRARVKTSPHKATIPCPKQVFRRYEDGQMQGDVIAPTGERMDGTPLLVPVMRAGRRVGSESLETMRARALAELEALPAALRDLRGEPRQGDLYPVKLSAALEALAGHAGLDE